MKVHELIEKLQKIPNQNMEVYVTNEYDEEPLEDITVGYIWEKKVLFLDNYGHDTEPKKKPEAKEMTPMEKFWADKLSEMCAVPSTHHEFVKVISSMSDSGDTIKIMRNSKLKGLDSDMVIVDEGVCDE